jgi:hypothetical protein
MVYLLATDAAFNRLKNEGALPECFWLNASGLGNDERLALSKSGQLAGWFVPPFDPSDAAAVAQAVETIEEHHAGSPVVVVAN